MKYVKYMSYVLRHKYYVGMECFKHGLFVQAITHDLSKLLPSEFIPYANHFYGTGKKGISEGRDKTGYYKPTDTGDKDFDFAWFLHQKRNKHHWQWWTLPEDEGGLKVLEMPNKYLIEMLCDWIGAGKAQGKFSPKTDKYAETRLWYSAHNTKMSLHPNTRKKIENIIYRHGTPITLIRREVQLNMRW